MVCLLLAGNLSLRKIYFPVEWYAFSPFKRKFLGDFLHFYASMDIKKSGIHTQTILLEISKLLN